MKKFLGNLWVMVASLVVLVFTSVSLVCVLANKLFYVGDYYSKLEYEVGEGEKIVDESWLNFNADNTVDIRRFAKSEATGETKEEVSTVWYYIYDGMLFQLGDTEEMTKEEYKEAVKEIKEMTDEEFKAYKDEMGYVISFKGIYLSNESSVRESSSVKYYHLVYKNSAKIPMVIVLSVVETLVLAFAAVSVSFFVLNKKNKPAEPVAETPAEEPAETPAE